MTCIICQESLFRQPESAEPGADDSGTAASTTYPAALGCGHVFHEKCIHDWHASSGRTTCPTCQQPHTGPMLRLHISVDEDYDQAASALSALNLSMEDPTADDSSLRGQQNRQQQAQSSEMDVTTAYGLSMVYQKEIEDLIEEKDVLRERIEELEVMVALEQSYTQTVQSEVDSLEKRAQAHRQHISSLQRHLNAKKAIIREYESLG
ncbi:hypothetical protein IWW55_000259 [Coemansia sp. RSA 2706]|nr:hypothetical protein IWW55_000259 [Coemansia sp. RSA 2706]KAJ2315441.1 hypothetical protein IWW54_000282 [Coemansia sp. RSA 2705]KAJ2322325.1 hypothetical protein IWW52_000158 [Coemansia sp. RSA 2704]KAJ2329926.1 E3 ubiquitin-protein ligase hrd1 [Coemansia sp. RSA 2702]KAJ2370451.1 hypothetical protein H4S01_000362 [Coemansia sp. RSA 2610]KAJ2393678.1 hypothetical protein H4S02_000040 [Coemansia sp. RSA 2611]KAJ2739897.1 E3 ubiquitin-protein ligase hrd1 [Coemansia sp. Cherry 401B]